MAYGEPGTGRMTGARYLHQLGRHAEGPFIACELTPANAHTLNELIARARGGTLVLSHSRASDSRATASAGTAAES